MKIFPRYSLATLLLVCFNFAFAQTGRAVLVKNYNVQASGLVHVLNKTQDTLILKSDKKINYLYTANREGGDKVKVKIDMKSYKLPLNRLKKGRNVMVAIQSPLKIVFVINVLKEFPRPFESKLTAVVD